MLFLLLLSLIFWSPSVGLEISLEIDQDSPWVFIGRFVAKSAPNGFTWDNSGAGQSTSTQFNWPKVSSFFSLTQDQSYVHLWTLSLFILPGSLRT
jgi:hypothetical protein